MVTYHTSLSADMYYLDVYQHGPGQQLSIYTLACYGSNVKRGNFDFWPVHLPVYTARFDAPLFSALFAADPCK